MSLDAHLLKLSSTQLFDESSVDLVSPLLNYVTGMGNLDLGPTCSAITLALRGDGGERI